MHTNLFPGNYPPVNTNHDYEKNMITEQVKLSDIFNVKESETHGQGLFSKTRIKKNSFLGTYSGRQAVNDAMHVLWAEDENGEWEGRHGQNILRYLNHHHQPSCEFVGFDLYALRDIDIDEELFIHYGPGFDSEEEITCL